MVSRRQAEELTRQAQEYWVRTGAENGGYRPETRLLLKSAGYDLA